MRFFVFVWGGSARGASRSLYFALSFPYRHSLRPGDPSVSSADSVSLRLGHGAALTCPRHVIHYRAAASLPLKLPRCSVICALLHMFFDRLKNPPDHSGGFFASGGRCLLHIGSHQRGETSRGEKKEQSKDLPFASLV